MNQPNDKYPNALMALMDTMKEHKLEIRVEDDELFIIIDDKLVSFEFPPFERPVLNKDNLLNKVNDLYDSSIKNNTILFNNRR